MLSKKALELYNNMKNEYIKNGYLYDGCFTGNQLYNIDTEIIKELKANKLIQVRNCQGYALELTLNERIKLNKQYNLIAKWLYSHSEFKLNILEQQQELIKAVI